MITKHRDLFTVPYNTIITTIETEVSPRTHTCTYVLSRYLRNIQTVDIFTRSSQWLDDFIGTRQHVQSSSNTTRKMHLSQCDRIHHVTACADTITLCTVDDTKVIQRSSRTYLYCPTNHIASYPVRSGVAPRCQCTVMSIMGPLHSSAFSTPMPSAASSSTTACQGWTLRDTYGCN